MSLSQSNSEQCKILLHATLDQQAFGGSVNVVCAIRRGIEVQKDCLFGLRLQDVVTFTTGERIIAGKAAENVVLVVADQDVVELSAKRILNAVNEVMEVS